MPPTSKKWTSKKRFHRRSVRLKTTDYGPGTTALITISCQDRQRFFGYNNRGTIEYSEAGRIAVETIAEMHEHHACKIEASIVMPEHVHVLILRESGCGYDTRDDQPPQRCRYSTYQ